MVFEELELITFEQVITRLPVLVRPVYGFNMFPGNAFIGTEINHQIDSVVGCQRTKYWCLVVEASGCNDGHPGFTRCFHSRPWYS